MDRIISDLTVFDVVKNEQNSDDDGGRQLTLTRLAQGVSAEEIREKTEAVFRVALASDVDEPALNESTLKGATA